jgi:hypothetical protein
VLAFAALAVDDPAEPVDALLEGAEVYAHPSPAITAAQGMAAAAGLGSEDGTPLAVVVIVYRDEDAWGAGCARCFRPTGDVHAGACVRSGPVMPHESVVRPLEQLTRSPVRV